ncbi:MAG: oligopeptide transporter, OPT family [Clostridiales Family XIII bacterium]|nr:oligopeptide transporter, OPT family [Clostridiales Family XIII bacterium]
MNDEKTDEGFRPFISADKILPELSPFSLIMGVLLAVIFGAANAYLGLRVGMTVSAAIPAAVISMGIMRGILKRDSILENNMVQTIGSAGESLAAGAIFTIPALFIWYQQWDMGKPSYLMISAIALFGGILGTLFMIPLRRALIVKEHGTLPYPEGTACAQVLLAGEEGGSKAKKTFIGVGAGALYKFIADGLKLFPSEVDWSIKGLKGTGIGADILPALLGVGYIVGARISAYMLAGGVIGWFVAMPIISEFGSLADAIIYPGTVSVAEMDHWALWENYIRYIGAGAVAFGGIFSLIQSLPLSGRTVKDSVQNYKDIKSGQASGLRTDRDLPYKFIIIGSLVIILVMGMTPIVPTGIGGALIIAIFGFFFATVASRIVGIVGSSNSPVSGMTIATLLITASLFKLTGNDGQTGMIATIAVGSVICIISAIAGDTSQDLKTGFLVGATPRKQQAGQLLGVVAAALAIGGILIILNEAWGFGSKELPAPQAGLMRMVVEGVMGNNMPWPLIIVGIGIGVALALVKIPVLPVAIGLYLPIHLSVPLIVGGLIRLAVDRRRKSLSANAETCGAENGILFSSGLIAGEGLVGIVLALFAVFDVPLVLPIPEAFRAAHHEAFQIGGSILFLALGAYLYFSSVGKKKQTA